MNSTASVPTISSAVTQARGSSIIVPMGMSSFLHSVHICSRRGRRPEGEIRGLTHRRQKKTRFVKGAPPLQGDSVGKSRPISPAVLVKFVGSMVRATSRNWSEPSMSDLARNAPTRRTRKQLASFCETAESPAHLDSGLAELLGNGGLDPGHDQPQLFRRGDDGYHDLRLRVEPSLGE